MENGNLDVAAQGEPKTPKRKRPAEMTQLAAATAAAAEALTKAMLAQLVPALEAVGTEGGTGGKVKGKGRKSKGDKEGSSAKKPRENKYTAYNLYTSIMGATTGVKAMNALGACWSQMDPERKQDLQARLNAIMGPCNQLAKEVSDGTKLDIAAQLALYEQQNSLQPFPWQAAIAPFAAMPNNAGKRKSLAPAEAAQVAAAAAGAAAAAQPPKKKHKQQQPPAAVEAHQVPSAKKHKHKEKQ